MDGIYLIQDLAVVLLGAGIAGIICKRIGLSVIVGYLLAGIAIGPYTPPFSFIHDIARIDTLSQIGLVFLMFAIGLGLSLSKFQKMGIATLIATALGAFLVFNAVRLLGSAFSWSPTRSLFVAGMLMVSSSAVIAKVVKDMHLGHERSGQLALGITVLEDVVAVVMLAVLGAQIATTGTQQAGMGNLLTGLTTFVVLVVIAGLLLLPLVLRRLETRYDPELQTIIVAGLLFLMALLSVKAGYSLALGAFLLGAVVADMPQKGGVEKSFSGMRDTFSSVFFVAIGMMIDVGLLISVWPWVLGLGFFTLLVRALAIGIALMIVGTPPREARRTGLLLTPLGEFTFVIAQLGVTAQILGPEMYPVAVGVSLFTVLLSPLINRHCEPVLRFLERFEPRPLKRFLESYHHWLVHVRNSQSGRLWWHLSKKRLLNIALEILFVTGVLIFSERILSVLRQHVLIPHLEPEVMTQTFWLLVGIIVLVPLVAIWLNLSALARIFADAVGSRPRFLAPIVENGFKIFSAIAVAYWLLYILPTESLTKWSWLAIAGLLGLGLAIFSRRLLFWHSQWKSSLEEVFKDHSPADQAQQRQWLERSSGWDIQLLEVVLPERAACSGQSIAELLFRSRFGCSIVEINRGGHTIISPEPTQALFSGDHLLLMGTPAQLAAAREGLEKKAGEVPGSDFEDALLETVSVPPGPRVGLTLAELNILKQTGVMVAGIERGNRQIINPTGHDRLLEGDDLLILGSPQQIRRFKTWLMYFCAESEK